MKFLGSEAFASCDPDQACYSGLSGGKTLKRLLSLFTVFTLLFAVTACDDDDDDNTNNTTAEICDNGIDDDGNGDTDCADAACVDDAACQEICDDGIDNDLDGDIDCEDSDCDCPDVIKHVTVIGTSDMHSHLMGVGPATDYTPLVLNDDSLESGLARIASVINTVRDAKTAEGVPTVLVDSGDYLMGDMVDLLSGSAPPAFHFFMLMGYDAATLGNHDFDWTAAGAYVIITAAQDSFLINFDIPLLSSNIVTSTESAADDGIEALIANGTINRYVIKTIDDDFAVGIFGKLGIEADSNVPQAKPVTWWHDDPEDLVNGYVQTQALVDEIRDDGADMVIHASHQGINANGLGEDRDVAANVTGIDVIMSGHRHQVISNPANLIKVGDTRIVGTGDYGRFVDQIDVAFNLTTGVIEDATATIHHIDDSIMGDATVAGIMDFYVGMLDSEVLEPKFGMTYSATPIAHTTFDVPHWDAYVSLPTGQDVESPAGLVVADAMRAVMNQTIGMAVADGLTSAMDPTFDASPVTMTVAEAGAVRDPLFMGNTGAVAAADAFRMFPLGIGPDMIPGYPMISFYVHPTELKIMLNMNVESIMGNVPFEYYLNPSGVRFIYDPAGDQFDRVVMAYACPVDDAFTTKNCFAPGVGTPIDLTDATSLIRIAVDYYVALLLPEARNALGENLIIDPKRKDGTVVDMNVSAEVASLVFNATPGDSDNSGTIDGDDFNELKVWVALLYFISNFSDDWSEYSLTFDEAADGMPSFPARIYSSDDAPTGQEAMWRLGLDRNMTVTQFCSIPGMSGAHPLCP